MIKEMRETINYQNAVIQKRESLVYAITKNVQYLAKLHTDSSAELRLTKERLEYVNKMNEELTRRNNELAKKCGELEKNE